MGIIKQLERVLKSVDDLALRAGEAPGPHEEVPYNGFKFNVCKACKDRFKTQKDLKEHYAKIHPGLSTGWLIKDGGVEE